MFRILYLVVFCWVLFVSIPLIADDDNHERGEKSFFSFLHDDDDDDDDDDDHHKKDGSRFYGKKKKLATITNKLYLEECGSCHMAFQPELLPSESWKKMMLGLEDHFGESAELEAQDAKAITAFLVKDAADKSGSKVSRKLLRGYKGNGPLRISELPYFIHEHDEVSASVIKRPAIKSWANCSACHVTAEQGSYQERYIKIPR